MQFPKRNFIVRGPNCSCGGECPACSGMLRRMHSDHAWEIKKATEHIPEEENEEK